VDISPDKPMSSRHGSAYLWAELSGIMNATVLSTIGKLIIANLFITIAWYGHLKLKEFGILVHAKLWQFILFSWSVALLGYVFLIPANRQAYGDGNGPFNMWQLRVVQEVIALSIYVIFIAVLFRQDIFRWNYACAGLCLVAAVYFTFMH
jgi:uncharacterized protein (DUF486 family)